MKYELTLADQGSGFDVASMSIGSSGQHDYLRSLSKHPLAISERGDVRHLDHVHLSQYDGTNIVVWMGRASNGYHYPIGRFMRLVEIA